MKQIRLTQTVQKGGCAAKVAAAELRKILGQVRFPPVDSNVIVDGGLFDDAAIYKISSEIALVQTLDFFTPIVDSPNLFGKIAAANAMSDVYAMGGEPKTAMAIFAFPMATLDASIAVEVLQGASDAMAEAGVSFVGGHSIDDDTIKFGLSVTGHVHPDRVWSNSKARVGDKLILTKALGTGTLTAGLKRGAWSEADMTEALQSMGQINRILDLLSPTEHEAIHSATDITGFGLAGHAMQMARASKVSFNFDARSLPTFKKTKSSLQESFLTKAHRSNKDYTQGSCDFSRLSDIDALVMFDPQTSGGLLLSVAPDQASAVLEKLRKRFTAAACIGEVGSKTDKDWTLN
ncbi:MAG: selenide, water dikinase SelD [Pseudobdellovibrionaceae bacterium]